MLGTPQGLQKVCTAVGRLNNNAAAGKISVPVGALFRIALLCFEINIEETVALFIAV